ncbi:hypothetical protein K503DRAFT_806569 [Rhizopogon vinicolor AM-OR11-026]|uniref:CCHC-type domain-containing protein n=1 Tax=Rhizopogon vinicolor AM-OR11-026 TaxID=1314800 RepID=A0A1B7MEA0_9AGAM|nr:hypothetical protein K503DRAFT_806569 [Rhizopogon vinicolor AM-OR11-026]
MLASDAWTKLCEHYEGKGKQTIAYLIGELFRGTLSDESPMEMQLNAMRHKAQVLSSLEQSLDDTKVSAYFETQSTLVAKTLDKAKDSNETKKRLGNCNYCQKPGHWERECRKKKAEKGKGKDDDENEPKEKVDLSAKVVHVVENDLPLQLFVVHDLKHESHPAKWIVDSGASAHMSCR